MSDAQEIVVLPTTINLTIYQGDDFYMDISVSDSAGNPVDLSNSQPMSQIRLRPDTQSILADIGITIDSGTVGLLHLHLAAIDSALLPKSAYWDIQVSSPNVITLASGKVTCNPQVTR